MVDRRIFEKMFNCLVEASHLKGCRGPKKWLEGIEVFLNGDEDRALELYLEGLEDVSFKDFFVSSVECELEALNMTLNARVMFLQRYLARQQSWMKEAA